MTDMNRTFGLASLIDDETYDAIQEAARQEQEMYRHIHCPDEGKWPWLQTYTGKAFVPLDPDPELIDIRDIAIGLSREARYNGHTRTDEPYSVAQHCVLVARVLPPPLKLWGLLHDAAEAYCKDLTWSIKSRLPEYKAIELPIERAIAKHFDLPWPPPPEIKVADNRMLATEKRDLMSLEPKPWRDDIPEPYDCTIKAWGHHSARFMFLETYNDLTGENIPTTNPLEWNLS